MADRRPRRLSVVRDANRIAEALTAVTVPAPGYETACQHELEADREAALSWLLSRSGLAWRYLPGDDPHVLTVALRGRLLGVVRSVEQGDALGEWEAVPWGAEPVDSVDSVRTSRKAAVLLARSVQMPDTPRRVDGG